MGTGDFCVKVKRYLTRWSLKKKNIGQNHFKKKKKLAVCQPQNYQLNKKKFSNRIIARLRYTTFF